MEPPANSPSPPGWHSRGLKEPWWSPPDSEKEKKGGESSPLAFSYSWIETAFTFTPLTVRRRPRGCRRGTPGSQLAPASRVSSTLHRRVPPAAGVAGGPGRLPGFSSETGESGKPTPVSERRLPQGPSPPTHHPRPVGRSQSRDDPVPTVFRPPPGTRSTQTPPANAHPLRLAPRPLPAHSPQLGEGSLHAHPLQKVPRSLPAGATTLLGPPRAHAPFQSPQSGRRDTFQLTERSSESAEDSIAPVC